MSTEKSDPARRDGESRWVFATLGRVCRLLHVQIPQKEEGGRDSQDRTRERERRRGHEDGKYKRD